MIVDDVKNVLPHRVLVVGAPFSHTSSTTAPPLVIATLS